MEMEKAMQLELEKEIIETAFMEWEEDFESGSRSRFKSSLYINKEIDYLLKKFLV